jgi:hypothetical protein
MGVQLSNRAIVEVLGSRPHSDINSLYPRITLSLKGIYLLVSLLFFWRHAGLKGFSVLRSEFRGTLCISSRNSQMPIQR